MKRPKIPRQLYNNAVKNSSVRILSMLPSTNDCMSVFLQSWMTYLEQTPQLESKPAVTSTLETNFSNSLIIHKENAKEINVS